MLPAENTLNIKLNLDFWVKLKKIKCKFILGLRCEEKYSECMNQPCLNNGTCVDYNGFMCQCPEGYSGDYCEIDASVCNNTICKNSGECVEGPGFTFSCRCAEGWTGFFCEEDVDECIASPCQNGGLCLNVPATYTCACLFGKASSFS